MKFTLALLAIGSQAVKLHQDDEADLGSWEARAARMHSVIDWDGSGTVDAAELQDLFFLAENLDYIDEDMQDELDDFADGMEEYFGGPWTAEEMIEEVNWVIENGTEEDMEHLDVLEGILEGSEEMLLDFALSFAFDYVDENGNDQIEVEEVDAMADELDLDDEERQDLYDGMEAFDENDDMQVSWDEFTAGMEWVLEEEPELKWEILEGAAELVNEYDVDCDADGVEGCDDERAEFQEEIESWE